MPVSSKIFLDSGAHSLFVREILKKQHGKLDFGFYETDEFWQYVEAYAEYVKANKDMLDIYVSVDVIHSPELSWKVQRYLEDTHKLSPLPVYHSGEDFKWFKKYCDNYDYIGVGGLGQEVTRSTWIKNIGIPVFSYICKKPDYLPIRKIHGFAMTAPSLVTGYPWYCMTDDHTILTKDGWKTRETIQIGDMVLTFKNGFSEWKPVEKIHEFDVVDAVVRKFKGENRLSRFEASVTHDHNWLTRTPNKRNEWEWRKTTQFTNRSKIPRTAKHLNFPLIEKYSDYLIKLIAWVWTDGCITFTEDRKERGHKKPAVGIWQSRSAHPKYVEEIRQILVNLDARWSESSYDVMCFDLSGKVKDDVVSILTENKVLSFDFILDLTERQLQMFVEEVLKGDGYYEKRKKGNIFNISQKDTRNLSAFGLACTLLGVPINSQKCSNGMENILSSNIHNYNPLSSPFKDELFTGKLWCIEVENHTFYTRCGGSYYWTGNSVDSTSWVMFGKYGIVIVPYMNGDKYDYTKTPNTVFVSSRPKSKSNVYHLDNVVTMHGNYFKKYFEDNGFCLGKSEFRTVEEGYKIQPGECWACKKTKLVETIVEKGLSNNHEMRDQLNLLFYLNLEKFTPPYPRPWKPPCKITQLF